MLGEFARLLLLAVILPALLLAGVFLWQAITTVREQTAARLTAAAGSYGREVDGFLDMHLAAIEVLAERRSASGDASDLPGWRSDLRRLHKHYPAFVTLLVSDRDGRLLSSDPALAGAPGLSVADREYFLEARRSGRAHVSNAFRGRGFGSDPLVAVSAPVFDGGRFAGIVQGSIRLDALVLPGPLQHTTSFERLLLDRNGTVLQASEGLPYRPLDVLRNGPLGALAGARVRAPMQRLRGVLDNGESAYAIAVPLKLGWQLVLLQPEHVVVAELRRNAFVVLGLLALVLGGALAIIGMKMRQLGGSVRGLLERMQHFALDRDSMPIVPENMPRELAPLAEAMHQLAARSRTAYEQVNLSLAEQRRLREELQAVAQRLLTAQEDERRTISRELHDDIGQAITAIKLCATALADDDDPVRQEVVGEIVTIADQTIVKLRNLSLLLRPPQLDSLGLEAALRSQVALLGRNTRTKIKMRIAPLERRPPADVEQACFRIAQEALTNAMRHAGAETVELALSSRDTGLVLEVSDDGSGFDPAEAGGLGLLTMRERAQQLGGTLVVRTMPGGGTHLLAKLPLQHG